MERDASQIEILICPLVPDILYRKDSLQIVMGKKDSDRADNDEPCKPRECIDLESVYVYPNRRAKKHFGGEQKRR